MEFLADVMNDEFTTRTNVYITQKAIFFKTNGFNRGLKKARMFCTEVMKYRTYDKKNESISLKNCQSQSSTGAVNSFFALYVKLIKQT